MCKALGTSYSELDERRSAVDDPPFSSLFAWFLMHGDDGSRELQDSFLVDVGTGPVMGGGCWISVYTGQHYRPIYLFCLLLHDV